MAQGLKKQGRTKEPVTIRLDGQTRQELQSLAGTEGRTVSSLIDEAVRSFLDRKLGRPPADAPTRLRVRYAMLPDTGVLHAFSQQESERFKGARERCELPPLEFVERPTEWRNLPVDVFSGDSDIVEAVNRLPLYLHFTSGDDPLPLDSIRPYLQIFVGHCVFIRRDHLSEFLDNADLDDFEKFRARATTGKDLSLRSLIVWAHHSSKLSQERTSLLEEVWQNAIIGCQLGTDFHIAIRRVSSVLAANIVRSDSESMAAAAREPNPVGVENLDRGLVEFRNGTLSAFAGNLLQAAELLADSSEFLLFAGPADLRVPSLNTMAAKKGIFTSQDLGTGVLQLWGEAVTWFRDEVVMSESPTALAKFVSENFRRNYSNTEIEILQSLMQAWVRWFVDQDEARAFMGDETDDLLRHYQRLGDCLHPTAKMPAPVEADNQKSSLWRFSSLPVRSESAPINIENE